jgi:hypothetical protein
MPIVKKGHKFPDPQIASDFSPETVAMAHQVYEVISPYLDLLLISIINIMGTALCVMLVALMVYGPLLCLILLVEKVNEWLKRRSATP